MMAAVQVARRRTPDGHAKRVRALRDLAPIVPNPTIVIVCPMQHPRPIVRQLVLNPAAVGLCFEFGRTDETKQAVRQ
jgi:hypothetical protein